MAQPFEILILDDEHDAADMMAEVLSLHLPQAAFRVAYTGEDAVQRGIAHRPGAAIFDLEMAGLGGSGRGGRSDGIACGISRVVATHSAVR